MSEETPPPDEPPADARSETPPAGDQPPEEGDYKDGLNLEQRLAVAELEKAFPDGFMLLTVEGHGLVNAVDPLAANILATSAAEVVLRQLASITKAFATRPHPVATPPHALVPPN